MWLETIEGSLASSSEGDPSPEEFIVRKKEVVMESFHSWQSDEEQVEFSNSEFKTSVKDPEN